MNNRWRPKKSRDYVGFETLTSLVSPRSSVLNVYRRRCYTYGRTKTDSWSAVGGGATAARCYHFDTVSSLDLRSHRSTAIPEHLAKQVRPRTERRPRPATRHGIRDAGVLLRQT